MKTDSFPDDYGTYTLRKKKIYFLANFLYLMQMKKNNSLIPVSIWDIPHEQGFTRISNMNPDR